MHGIDCFFFGLRKYGVWESLYSQLDPKQLSNLIYNSIIHQLDDER